MESWKSQRPIKQLLGGRYRLGRSLGRGGMAEVYLAWDEQKKREVAIKVMIPNGDDPRRSERFLREGETAVSLHHQHIIAVYDYGDCIPAEIGNNSGSAGINKLTVPYIVMEYIKGGT